MLIPEPLLPAALSRAVAGTAVVVGMATPALYTADAVHRAARSGMNGRERERRGDTPRTAARSSTTSRSSAARSLSDGTADPDAASKPMRARTCHVPSSKGREVRGVPRGINGHHSEERTRQHGVVRRGHVSTGWYEERKFKSRFGHTYESGRVAWIRQMLGFLQPSANV